jgi:hypothetical protein
MRPASRLLARASSVGTPSGGLGVVPHALLPPIPLYRRLLRGHRKHLPAEMRILGDEYIKSEFRAHRNVENPIHIVRPTNSLPRRFTLTCILDWVPYRMAGLCSAD